MKTIAFQIPSRLNHFLEQLAELPLNVVTSASKKAPNTWRAIMPPSQDEIEPEG